MTRTAAILMLLTTGVATAAPPPGVSSTGPVADWVHRWVNTLAEGCCGLDADCRPTAVLPREGTLSGYVAWIDKQTYGPSAPDAWVEVPVKAFSDSGRENPTGVSWACWYSGEVRCASLAGGY